MTCVLIDALCINSASISIPQKSKRPRFHECTEAMHLRSSLPNRSLKNSTKLLFPAPFAPIKILRSLSGKSLSERMDLNPSKVSFLIGFDIDNFSKGH